MKLFILSLVSSFVAVSLAQLTASVGPLTSIASKAAVKTCSVLDYGAKADKSTDLGPPLVAAFQACKSGGLVVVPSGDYAISTWATLNGGSAWALQLDGTIYRTGTAGGNMIFIEHTSDFELFSSTGKGAFQGNGYIFHQSGSLSGPRILRFYDVKNFSIHDVVLVDAPAFHFSLDTCSNGEVYNMNIRGGEHGGLDGIDVWSSNIWIHDVMVTNKDECVTVKSPSKNILVENIYCNDSGGSAFGSLGADTAISNIVYRNVYTVHSNQMLMIKSNGGSGYVENVLFENFIGHGNAYSLDVDQYWSSMSTLAGPGVALSNMTFRNWKGTEANGAQRGPIKMACADGAPCTGMVIEDFAMWTETGSKQFYSCRSAHGSGFCLKPDTSNPTSYAATSTTVSSAPTGYGAPTMPDDLSTGFGFTVSIPIPTAWPASYFPGAAIISPLGTAGNVVKAVVTSSSTTPASTIGVSTSISKSLSAQTVESITAPSTSTTSTSLSTRGLEIPNTMIAGPALNSTSGILVLATTTALPPTGTSSSIFIPPVASTSGLLSNVTFTTHITYASLASSPSGKPIFGAGLAKDRTGVKYRCYAEA